MLKKRALNKKAKFIKKGRFVTGMEPALLVVGGGSGIGKAVARRFRGHKVIIAGRDAEKLRKAAKEEGCEWAACDITRPEQIDGLLKGIAKRYTLTTVINAAGVNVRNRSFAKLTDADIKEIIGINLTGALMLSRALLATMKAGLIIHIGSCAGHRTQELSGPAYCAAKRGLVSLVHSINLEGAKRGLPATLISPASVNTAFLNKRPVPLSAGELKEKLQPHTIAEIAFFFASQPKEVVIEQILLASLGEVDLL